MITISYFDWFEQILREKSSLIQYNANNTQIVCHHTVTMLTIQRWQLQHNAIQYPIYQAVVPHLDTRILADSNCFPAQYSQSLDFVVLESSGTFVGGKLVRLVADPFWEDT